MATQYFVLNLLACDEKDYDKFVYGLQQPAGMTNKPTLNDLRKVLEERGSKNVVLVQLEKTTGVFFVFVDIDSAKAEGALDFKNGTTTSFMATATQLAAVNVDKAASIVGDLSVKSMVISHCFEAFPLIKDELKKNGVKVNDDVFDKIEAEAEKFEDFQDGLEDVITNPDVDKAKAARETLNQWCQKVFEFVKAIFSDVPDRKPDPVPGPNIPDRGLIIPECGNCKNLEERLIAANGKVSQLEDQVKKLKDENTVSKATIVELKKTIEELKMKTPEPPKPRPEPTILNTTIEFKPKKFTKDGKEEILFFVMMGYYKHYYIAKDCAEQLKLDKTKPVKLIIESFATHCHTDEEEESKIATEYYVPKGEDFFICRGKVAP